MAGMNVWRLSRRKYAREPFTGEGPKTYGGRWNSVGVPVVYTSLFLSLAVLEVFVHMTLRADPEEYVSVNAELGVDETLAERVDVTHLPAGWRTLENPALRAIGDPWARSKRSLVLLVPSVVVPEEWNAVVNPLHPDASRIKVGEPQTFQFDERMFKARS